MTKMQRKMKQNRAIRGAIFDIDGTLAMMDKSKGTYTALPGAVEILEICRDAGVPVVAYTNGTFFPPAHYYPLLADAGLIIAPDHVVTPASVASYYLKEQGYKRVMVLGDAGTRVPMEEAGFDVVDPVGGRKNVEVVLVGWTRNFGLVELEAVCEAIWAGAIPFTSSDAPFFASSKGRMLGVSGAISAMIAKVTGQSPTVLGKPSTLGMDMAAKLIARPPSEIAVIGDDPMLEIAMARKAGALAIGVATGIADTASFNAADPNLRAHQVIASLEELQLDILEIWADA